LKPLFSFLSLLSVVAAPQEYTFEYDYIDRTGEILERKGVKPNMKKSDIDGRPVILVIDEGTPICSPPNRLPVAVSYASHLGMYAQATLARNSHGKEELTLSRFNVLSVIDASVVFSSALFATVHVSLQDQPIILGDGRRCPGVTANIVKLVGDLFKVNLENNIMGVVLLGIQADCKVIARKEVLGMKMGDFEDSIAGRLETLYSKLNEKYRPLGCDTPPVMVGLIGVGTRNMMTLNSRAVKKVELK
jgi:hypothetical protein